MAQDLLGLFLPACLSFVLVAGALPFARRLARKWGFLDRPGGRKDHAKGIPPVGGLVIFPVALAMAWIFGALDPMRDAGFLSALILLLGLGAIDDARGLPAGLRFALQTVAALFVVLWGGAVIMSMGNLFGLGEIVTGRFGIPLTVFCVVLLINAMNMVDGLDGLAGGLALTALFWLVLAQGPGGDSGLAMAVAGAIGGFLVYNMRNPLRRKACVFLGDSGSMALGLTLAWLCIRDSQGADAPILPVSVAWILGVPVMDAFALFVTRLSHKQHPFKADRRHFHHHFIHAGMTPGRVSVLIALIGFVFGAIAIMGPETGCPEPVLMGIWTVFLLVNTAICARHERFVQWLSRKLPSQGLKPANDIGQPLIDPHGNNGNKNAKFQRNP